MSLERSTVGVDGSAWGTLTQPGMSVTLQHQVSGAAYGPSPGSSARWQALSTTPERRAAAFCNTNLWSLKRE